MLVTDFWTKTALNGAVFYSLLTLTTFAHGQNKLFRCVGQGGSTAFQDFPCTLGQKPWAKEAVDLTRWRTLGKAGCRIQSPLMPLYYGKEEDAVVLKGGALLDIMVQESGIRADLVLRSAISGDVEILLQEEQRSRDAALAEAQKPKALAQSDASVAATDATKADTITTPASSAQNNVARANERLLELSGDIRHHAVITSLGQRFGIDSMSDSRRIGFGFWQSSEMLNVLSRSPTFHFALGIRSPSLRVRSQPLESSYFREALNNIYRCQRERQQSRATQPNQ